MRLPFVVGLLALAGSAGVSAAPTGRSKHVQATLLAEPSSVKPGTPFTVGFRLEMDEGWHTYWRNPGDSGLPTKVRWTLPEGFTSGEIQWPVPERIPAPPLMSYGYEEEVLLLVELTPPATLPVGRDVTLAARLDWLECEIACIPGRAQLDLVLPVRETPPLPSPTTGPLFAEARRRLPQAAEGWTVKAARAGAAGYVLEVTPPAGTEAPDPYFFVAVENVADYAKPQAVARRGAGFRITVPASANGTPADRLSGVLVLGPEQGGRTLDVPIEGTAVAEAGAPVTPSAAGGTTPTLAAALGLAFVGGLLLNLMPCVLPVLALKVMGFVRHSDQGRLAGLRHGAAYTAGVVLSFWVLAGALLAFRAAGEQIGWGFQLQSPAFVALLTVLFFLMGLNLFGVFEVGTSLVSAGGLVAGREGVAASFWGGALATIVATPCTAPFMGSALGYGLSQTSFVAMLVFTSLALGMALPYLVLSGLPELLRFVPKPGAWMVVFRQLMGFLLMATVVVLGWIFGQQTDAHALSLLLAGLLVVGLGAWTYGIAASTEAPRRRLATTAAALVLVLAGAALTLVPARTARAAGRASVSDDSGIAWETWSEARVAALRAEGKPVFVDFTAAWCLTCKVNERMALGSAEVVERFRRDGVVALKADWTLKDEAITRALASFGRTGVPLYVVYGKDASRPPRVLPEVITSGIVLAALDQAR